MTFEKPSYVAEIKRLALSWQFILGCVLITVGTVGEAFFNFSWVNMAALSISAVHIAALWMVVYEAKRGDSDAHTQKALTMFKFALIFFVAMTVFSFALMGLNMVLAQADSTVLMVYLMMGAGIAFLYIKFYLLAFIKVVKSIRERLSEKGVPLEGLRAFMIASYLIIGLTIFSSLAGMGGTVETFTFEWSFIFIAANAAGMLLCLRTLKKFE